VRLGECERYSGLPEIVADADLAAEGVATGGYCHFGRRVGLGVEEDGDIEAGELYGVCDAFFIAEVWQGDDYAVDFVAVLREEFGALFRVGIGLDGAVLCLLH